jgi:hypothetical protein
VPEKLITNDVITIPLLQVKMPASGEEALRETEPPLQKRVGPEAET